MPKGPRKVSPEHQGKTSSYTIQVPRALYLKLKFYVAALASKTGRHVTVNEVIIKFIEAGLADFDPGRALVGEE